MIKSLKEMVRKVMGKPWPGQVGVRVPNGLKALLDLGKEQGLISDIEDKMIKGIVELKKTVVREVMVPRTEMIGVDFQASVEEAVNIMMASGHSRIPAFRESLDNIAGMVYAKDILRHWQSEQEIRVNQVMRPAYFIPETKNTLELLEEFKRRRTPIAIVVDEYGGTSGLVTIEDLLEEIVGDIRDEYDQPEEKAIVEIQPGVFLVDARTPIEELEETLGVTLPKEDFDTVGGLIFHLTGRIPRTGEEIQCPPLKIRIEGADERRITRVKMERLPAEPTEEAPGQ